MQKYLDSYIQMISLRGLTDHTVKSYCTYLKAFLNYLDTVLYKPWNPYQLPMRKFDSYLPFVPTKEEMISFISSLPDLKQKATDLLTLKALLGHKSLNFTTIYVQLASNGISLATSPFDTFGDSSHA